MCVFFYGDKSICPFDPLIMASDINQDFVENTLEFRGSYRFFSGITGSCFGQNEWAFKNKVLYVERT